MASYGKERLTPTDDGQVRIQGAEGGAVVPEDVCPDGALERVARNNGERFTN